MVEETTQAVQEAADPNAKYQNLDPNQVLSVIPLLPYHEVADIGAGTGYFTVPLGKHLFDGKVYGIDDDQAALDGIQ
jgi:trans-aconitate methyltransferase